MSPRCNRVNMGHQKKAEVRTGSAKGGTLDAAKQAQALGHFRRGHRAPGISASTKRPTAGRAIATRYGDICEAHLPSSPYRRSLRSW